MKLLFMLLTLFIPATSVLAESTDHQNLIEMYRTYPDRFEIQRAHPEPIYEEEFIILKLIQTQDNKQQIKTIKANLKVRQRLLEAIT